MENTENQLENMELNEMEVVQQSAEQFVEQPEECVSTKPISPFADSPYIMQVQPAQAEPAVKTSKEKKHSTRTSKKIVAGLLAVVVLLGCCGLTALGMDLYWQQKLNKFYLSLNHSVSDLREDVEKLPTNGGPTIMLPDGSVVDGALTPAQVYAMNVSAVVAISNQGQTTNIFGQVSDTASSGSGFIVSQDGYIVSNYHVVKGAKTLTVIMSNGREYPARLVGYDETNDISVLKIDTVNLPYVNLGNSDALVVGDQVAAIGNPLGELTSTLTMGYISAKDRRVNTDGTYLNMLQTDAAINSGNSGGPLFNMRGEVIGITTAKYSGTSTSGATIEGIGFAIPIDDVKDVIEDLCRFGYVKSGYLGVVAQDVDAYIASQYGLPMGALVVDVVSGGCAQRAGIQKKDIITDIGGYKITSLSDLSRVLRNFEGGEATVITICRGGSFIALNIVLDAKTQQ